MRAGLRHALLATVVAATALGGCGPSKSDGGGGGGGGGGSGFPQPGLPGTPIGDPSNGTTSPNGVLVGSADGHLVVDVPPGAIPVGTAVTVQEVTNLAPGGVGPAWRVGPEGTTFPAPVTLTFYSGSTGRPVDELTVAWQDDQGYWHRYVPASVARDPVANTLSIQTSHLSTWTITTTSTARDFHGPFSVGTSANGPFVASGNATFTFAGEDAGATYYLLSGSLVLPSALGPVTCTPVAPDTDTFTLRTNVAELSKTLPVTFDWGTSGAWHVLCSDGTTRLVTVAFDTQGIGFTGCTRVVTRGEVAGLDAALGSVSWDCTARNLGQTSGSWDYASAACGTACVPADPCKTGTVICGTGVATCTGSGDVLDGASCGTDQVCSAGTCVGCTAGTACTPANACHEGVTSCATGASACVDSTDPPTLLADGISCGVDLVCSAGACQACVANQDCAPPASPCHQGKTSCATGTSICEDTGFAVTDGRTCGASLVCYAGACIACAQDAVCNSTNVCAATATYECSTGAAVCTDRTSQPAGTSCGSGLVCSAQGVCNTCSPGATCALANPCALPGTTDCSSGSPVCVPAGYRVGESCGSGLVCSADGQCLECASGLTCTIPGSCHAGTTTCASGTPVCVDTATPLPNGVSCGPNLVCNGGNCNSCVQGGLCDPGNSCVTTANFECGSGSSVCTPTQYLPTGASCGPAPDSNLFCNAAHACVSCAQGTTCPKTNPCAFTATIQCGTGSPVCTDQGLESAGFPCAAGSVCTASGTCTACTQGTACTSTNPCATSATMECSSGPVCTDRTFLVDGTACGSGLACNSGQCTASRTVAGTRTATYWTDAAVSSVPPPNAATSQVSALVREATGTWSNFPGAMDSAGAFSVAGVPNGAYWLKFQEHDGTAAVGGATFVQASAGSSFDLGFDQLGRADVATTAAATVVTFPVTLTANWGTNDQVQIASGNADVAEWLTRSNPSFVTNFAQANTSGAPLNLIRTGDVVTMFHLVSTRDNTSNLNYRAAVAKKDRSNLDVPGGSPVAAPAFSLSASTSTALFPGGTWSIATFNGYRAAMNVVSNGATHQVSIGASVGTLTGYGPVSRNTPPTLFFMSTTGTTNRNIGTNLSYLHALAPDPADPILTTPWTEWRGVEFGGANSFTATNANTSVSIRASMGRRDALSALSPLTPTLSPVTTFQIAATGTGTTFQNALSARTGVGLTPTLRWTTPALGRPTSYVVEVFRLDLSGTGTKATPVATLYLAAPATSPTTTTLPIPPGVFTAGARHFVRITARAIPGDPWATAPLRRIVVGSWAQTLSATITP